jgi:hypothetical protein
MSKHAETSVNRERNAAALQPKRATDHPYLVRLGPTRWAVRGGSPGYNDETLLRSFAAIVDCLRVQADARAGLRVDRRSVRRRSRHTLSPASAL